MLRSHDQCHEIKCKSCLDHFFSCLDSASIFTIGIVKKSSLKAINRTSQLQGESQYKL